MHNAAIPFLQKSLISALPRTMELANLLYLCRELLIMLQFYYEETVLQMFFYKRERFWRF